MHEIFIQPEEQRAILDTVRRFVDDEVRPRSPELDANPDPEESFSWEIIEAANELGIRTMTLSEDYDGLGTDSLTTAMVVEELAKGDLGISVVFAQTLKLAQIMEKALNNEQRERVLPKFVADPRCCLAIGITEPDNASNYGSRRIHYRRNVRHNLFPGNYTRFSSGCNYLLGTVFHCSYRSP